MRNQFIKTLTELAEQDRNTVLITGDLGFGVLTEFEKRYPMQYMNAGIAEQLMTGLAVGMALEGKTAYTYSIANFPTLRCLEQIRNDASYHNANVKIIAVGGGFSYGSLGVSHHATEDLAIMRAIPDTVVLAPGDPIETDLATRAMHRHNGTCYLRLGRGGEPIVNNSNISFEIGKANRIFEGDDVALISTGGILKNAFEARMLLESKGISTGLYSMHTLKPFDEKAIEHLASTVKLIVTIEEHSILGGLGGAVAETLAESDHKTAKLKRIGLRAGFSKVVGDQEYLRHIYGLSTECIINTILEEMERTCKERV